MVTIPSEQPIIQPINRDWYQDTVANIDILRLDMVHPVVSGNKWYKLKYNLKCAFEHHYNGVLTFGGAYSNHLIATAAAASHFQINSIGIIRGEEHSFNLNETLQACDRYGMKLVFVSRSKYKEKDNEEWINKLKLEYPNYFVIPEGGANEQGVSGASEIGSYIPQNYTHICVSVGTGTTLAGISNVMPDKKVLGYAPMKGGVYLNEVLKKSINHSNWQVFDAWHFGGFGKSNQELVDFMNSFYKSCKIPLDRVYTAKMMYGIKEQLLTDYFPNNASILCVHTGGLQGNKSLSQKLVY